MIAQYEKEKGEVVGTMKITYDTPGTGEGEKTYEVEIENTPPARPTLKDRLVVEVQRLVKVSKNLQDKINNAKTKAKKDYYLKKLKKNNTILMDMLLRLDAMTKKEEQNEQEENNGLDTE